MTAAPKADRLSTGSRGLDRILEGGFLRGGVYVVEGPPGAGKTLLANQLCFHAARQGERALYTTLLAESHERLLAHLQRMTFFDAELVPESVYYISGFRPLQEGGLPGLLRLLREAIVQRKPTVLVLDGLVTAEEVSLSQAAAGSALTQDAESSQHFKQFIHELQSVCAMTRSTVLLLSSTERPRLFHPAYTMVDGILELTNELSGLNSVRKLHVHKMRGTNQLLGKHNFEINDQGFIVHPRMETRLSTPRQQELEREGNDDPRLPFGVRGLDTMLAGGVPSNSMTMVVGPTGTGKTVLSMQYLCEGARRGERGLFFGFYERPNSLLQKARRLGLRFHEYVEAGMIDVVWQAPVEAVIDVLAARLFDAVRERRPRRLVIDSIQGFQLALDDYPARLRGVFSAMTDELASLGVTTLYTLEARELFGPKIEVPISGVSAATHNLILLRHVELHSQLKLLLTVLKVRDSGHDRAVRELIISDRGLRVAEPLRETQQALSASALYPARTSARSASATPKSKPTNKRKR